MAKVMQIIGERQIRIIESDIGSPGKGQVKIKTFFTAISRGTELAIYRGTIPQFTHHYDSNLNLFMDGAEFKYPLSCGYTNVGEIIQVGEGVNNLNVGDIVFSFGTHATEIISPVKDKWGTFVIPEKLDSVFGTFIPLGSVAYNAILDGEHVFGDILVIFGAGVIGQLLTQISKRSGFSKIIVIDIIASRLELAKKNGADIVLNTDETKDIALEVRKVTDNRGADLVVECTGSYKALYQAIRCACYNGKVVVTSFYQGEAKGLFLGEEFHYNRIKLISSQSGGINPVLSGRWDCVRRIKETISLLDELNLQPLITHRIPFSEIASAYEILDKNPDEAMQVVLTY